MNRVYKLILRWAVMGSVIFSALSAAAAESRDGCLAYDAPGQSALTQMRQDPQPIKLTTAASPQVELGRTYRLGLLPQTGLSFAVPPERRSRAEGVYGGMVQFTSPASGRYRINISAAAWVDLVSNAGKLQEVVAFKGDHQCQALRKYVEYRLDAGTSYTIQFSGGSKPELILVLSSVE
jgi:hypothetical protein